MFSLTSPSRRQSHARAAMRQLALLVGLLLLWLAVSSGTSAHAFLKQTTPDQNGVAAQAPSEATMAFTERIEPNYSTAQLFDANGVRVHTAPSHVGTDPAVLVLPLPAGLADGTYTIQWNNVSAEDGHSASGYFAFTIGDQANVVIPSPPSVRSTSSAGRILSVAGRWLSLIGISAAIGSFLTWLLAVRAGIEAIPAERRVKIARRIRALALAGLGLAALGSLILLVGQTLILSRSAAPGEIGNVLDSTRFGGYLVVRAVLLAALAGLLYRRAPWSERPSKIAILPVVLVSLAVPFPFAMISHAAAQPSGREMAIGVDWLHLLAASVWIGGLLTLSLGVALLRDLPPAERRVAYGSVIPRFSTMAIGSVVILAVTGFYASWLEVGDLAGLTSTSYGRTLLVKLLLLLPILAIGAGNLLVIGPRMRRSRHAPVHFNRSIIAEAVIGVVILLSVGLLTTLPTAREALSTAAEHPTFAFNEHGMHATLQISPSTAGLNKYTVDASDSSGSLPAGTQVLLRVSPVNKIGGQREIVIPPLPGSPTRFESQGRDLSVVGNWMIELVVRRPNTADWSITTHANVTRTAGEHAKTPPAPPRFGGVAAFAAVVIGAIAVIILVGGLRGVQLAGVRLARGRLLIGDSLMLFGICTLLLGASWSGASQPSSQSNPIKMTSTSVAAGQSLFVQNCAQCHGDYAFGDGPLAASLNPPPGDLHAGHVDDHTDLQLFLWIQNGIPGTSMAPLKEKLTDAQIWNLINYVRSLRHPV